MKSLLTTLALILCSVSLSAQQTISASFPIVSGTATFVASNGFIATTAVQTISCPALTAAAGDTFFVEYNFYDNHAITVSDTGSYGTVSLVPLISGSYPVIWNYGIYDYLSVITNAGSGSHVITVTDSAIPGIPPFIQCTQVRGASSTSPVDSASSTATSSNTITATSVTTTAANELMLTFCALNNQYDPISASNTPQTMNIGSQTSAGLLAGYGAAATVGANYTQCIDTNSYGDPAIIDLIAVH